jgi:hypothetical protein
VSDSSPGVPPLREIRQTVRADQEEQLIAWSLSP